LMETLRTKALKKSPRKKGTWAHAIRAVHVPLALALAGLALAPRGAQGSPREPTAAPEEAMRWASKGVTHPHQQTSFHRQAALSGGQPVGLPNEATASLRQTPVPGTQGKVPPGTAGALPEESLQYPDEASAALRQATRSERQPTALPGQAASVGDAAKLGEPRIGAAEKSAGYRPDDRRSNGPAANSVGPLE
jgi:hypothetical protein